MEESQLLATPCRIIKSSKMRGAWRGSHVGPHPRNRESILPALQETERKMEKAPRACFLMAELLCFVLSRFSRVWLFATLQAALSMGFSRQEYWAGSHVLLPGGLPNLWIEPRSPTLQVDSLPSKPPGKPKRGRVSLINGQWRLKAFCLLQRF